MKQQRKAVLAKYGIATDEFEKYADKLDASCSTPEGQKKRQKLFLL